MKRNHTKSTRMKILVIRNSAMGDVLLTLPVLLSFSAQYPGNEVTILTSSSFAGFFDKAMGIKSFGADYKQKYSGASGLVKLFIDLRVEVAPDIVIDLHDVIRSRFIRLLFRMAGIPVFSVDKGRREKKSIIAGKEKKRLPHTVERYAKTFSDAGFVINVVGEKWLTSESQVPSVIEDAVSGGKVLIGVAPFAKHKLKMWPIEKMSLLLQRIEADYGATIILFGGGSEEIKGLRSLAKEIPGSIVAAGQMKIDEEISLISRLQLMIAMDSSNMHLGALAGVPTVSIWGATHPMMGFSAWGQPEEYSVQVSEAELDCRPCTVYGKGECRRKDFACMNTLSPDSVLDVIRKILG